MPGNWIPRVADTVSRDLDNEDVYLDHYSEM